MTNLSSLALTQAELDVLAHNLAYEHATSVIETHCDAVDTLSIWFDTDPTDIAPEAQASVVNCVAYLEARGLLERHDDKPDWVTISDESEAVR